MISRTTIERILETARIGEVVADFVNLKRRGVNMVGLCPFHSEKTPSFNVSPSRGIYKCFGCGVAGNSVKFIMEHEHYSFPEALRYLAQKYHIQIEETQDTALEKELEDKKDSLFIVTGFAGEYFAGKLFEEGEGKSIGFSYFHERGFRKPVIRQFGLGYAPDTGDGFYKEAIRKKYNPEYLEKAGLITRKNDSFIDFFRGRVIFPIHNLSGKVIAFGARVPEGGQGPKYINSPESEIYRKSNVLYGLFFARQAIRKQDECLLVEGYTDVLSLHQAGMDNAVASGGTSLTPDQVRLVSRYTSNITVLYDGDEAGILASLRGVDIILEQDMNVRIVVLPEGEDPDSFVRKAGAGAMQDYIVKNRKDFLLFKAARLLQPAGEGIAAAGPVQKTEAIRSMVESIAKIRDPIKRALYTKECSVRMEIRESMLIHEVNKLIRNEIGKRTGQAEAENPEPVTPEAAPRQSEDTGDDIQEGDVIRVLLEHGDKILEGSTTATGYVLHELEGVRFLNPVYAEILQRFAEDRQSGKNPALREFIHSSNPSISEAAIHLTTSRHPLSENWLKKHDIFVSDRESNYRNDVYSAVARLLLRKTNRQINELLARGKRTEPGGMSGELAEQHSTLMERKKHLCSFLRTVVTGR